MWTKLSNTTWKPQDIGQIALSVTILIMRSLQTPAYLAPTVFLIAVGLISSSHVIAAYLPDFEVYAVITILPSLLILGPALWFYIEGLTSETLWHFETRHFRHMIPFCLGALVCIFLILLPIEEQKTMFIEGEVPERLYPSLIVVAGFFLILGWFGQAGYYLVRAARHLSNYRVRLKDIFSSTEKRELSWIGAMFGLLGCAWLVTVVFISVSTIYGQEIIDPRFGASMSLMIIWLLSIWGLRQKPGFEDEYGKANSALESDEHLPSQKYHRSALETSRAKRIAGKIEAAMRKDKLYLNPNLSLNKLSNHIAVTPNHISQTLNETMNPNFF